MAERFIHYAEHGGCAAKLEADRLTGLLDSLSGSGGWSDAGIAEVDGMAFASSVDVVLPMIDDPALFGRIVVTHVLSDLYAVGAEPVFALNVLAVPKLKAGSEDSGRTEEDLEAVREIDANVATMLAAADACLRELGVASVGGHTLKLEALIFGLAATGKLPAARRISNAEARPGDLIVLTKPLGTSIATKCWKGNRQVRESFEDVVAGMLTSNKAASEAMLETARCSCTDVTGFGLLGHLKNMLTASGTSAVLRVDDIPIYESVRAAIRPGQSTRIFDSNMRFVGEQVDGISSLTPEQQLLLVDAQISGGLLVAVPAAQTDSFLEALVTRGVDGSVIGTVTESSAARITLT